MTFENISKALRAENHEFAIHLLSQMPSIVRDEGDRKTVLHIAAEVGNFDFIKAAAEKPGFQEALNQQSNDGSTALHYAVQSQNSELVNFFLSEGANASLVNRDNQIPYDLLQAMECDPHKIDQVGIIKSLLKHLKDPQPQQSSQAAAINPGSLVKQESESSSAASQDSVSPARSALATFFAALQSSELKQTP